MAQDVSGALLSYADYAALEDDGRYQVIEGELVMTPSPSRPHQQAIVYLVRALDDHARATRAGSVFVSPFDVVLRAERPAVVVQPDLLFVSKGRASVVTKANVQGAPDLAVEVLSPASGRLDTVRKRRLYEQYGVQEYWIVDVEADQVQVYVRSADGSYGKPALYLAGDHLTSTVLPGLAVDVTELFARASEGREETDGAS